MIFLLRNIVVYAYSENGSKLEIDELITELKMNCSLDKPYQQVNFTIPYGVYNEWFPHYFIDTGTKIELYDIYGEAVFRGTVNKVTLNSKNQTLECVVYDYIYNICQDGVYYNFKGMSAYDCICKMFDDLQVPYNSDGILSGKEGQDSSVSINHIIKNKSAYDTIMAIATECHQQFGYYYYIYMDVSGNVNVTPCDKYWAKQTIKTSSVNKVDGNVIDCSYTKDASKIITKVLVYTSSGEEANMEKGSEEEDSED